MYPLFQRLHHSEVRYAAMQYISRDEMMGRGQPAQTGSRGWRNDAPQLSPTKESLMLRMSTAIVLIGLASTPALAESAFESRVHEAATAACAVESAPGARPVSHYGKITEACVSRLSRAALAQAAQNAKLATANRIAGN
jgi:hypothetical protein